MLNSSVDFDNTTYRPINVFKKKYLKSGLLKTLSRIKCLNEKNGEIIPNN